MTVRVAFFADTHLGYATRCRSHTSGLNMRVYDGYIGLKQTVDQILEADVDVVLHGGDLFHKSHPTVSDISWARKQFNRLADSGIPVIGVTGNHDFANDRGKSSATAAMDDPARGISMVTGSYEIFEPKPGVNVHAISHLGLISEERSIPEIDKDSINILISHGAAQVPGHEIFATVDSPGEAVLGYDVISAPWTVGLLGHYHGMGALPGFDKGERGQVWYSGSLLRRGFSDPEGGRGWLLIEIENAQKSSITPQYIKQRPQFDLAPIDASGKQASEVESIIVDNLESIEKSGAIIRQRVINCPLSIRRAVDTRRLAEIASDALVWQPEFIRPEKSNYSELNSADKSISSLTSAGTSDLPRMYEDWFAEYSEEQGIAKNIRPAVKEKTTSLLREVSKDIETETSELNSDGGPF